MLSDADLGHWVHTFRKAAGLSQQQLADLLECARPTISAIESGQRKLTATEFIALLGARPQPRARRRSSAQPVQVHASNEVLDDAGELVRIISRRSQMSAYVTETEVRA